MQIHRESAEKLSLDGAFDYKSVNEILSILIECILTKSCESKLIVAKL